jgi:hypothetical protein
MLPIHIVSSKSPITLYEQPLFGHLFSPRCHVLLCIGASHCTTSIPDLHILRD